MWKIQHALEWAHVQLGWEWDAGLSRIMTLTWREKSGVNGHSFSCRYSFVSYSWCHVKSKGITADLRRQPEQTASLQEESRERWARLRTSRSTLSMPSSRALSVRFGGQQRVLGLWDRSIGSALLRTCRAQEQPRRGCAEQRETTGIHPSFVEGNELNL